MFCSGYLGSARATLLSTIINLDRNPLGPKSILVPGVDQEEDEVPLLLADRQEATDQFGWFAHFAGIDCPASSRRTRELLGWQPKLHEVRTRRNNTNGFIR